MILIVLLSGCKIVDAPEDLESLVVFGFVHFEDDPSFLKQTATGLLPLIELHREALSEGYRVADLTATDLEGAGIDAPVEGGILGAVGLVGYHNRTTPVIDAISRPDKAAMFPDNYLAYELRRTSDRACFLDATCDRLDQTAFERTKVVLLGEAERTFDIAYRSLLLDEGTFTFVRQITPEPMSFSTGLATVHQQYSFVMLFDEGTSAQRIEAFWVDAEILGLDVPDSYAVDQAVSAMADQAERVDAWIDTQP
ncbi:MAG TPA: hypothetical protein ENK18_08690 [Deltaproteobacteria bacterium]|nr:hypothetical protein [Deltaproteobacteria bacterium]